MPIFGITASSNQTVKFTDFYQIATTTVGATSVSSVSFDNIPQDYTHLQIRYTARGDRTITNYTFLYVEFNNDTATNYAGHGLDGDGASASSYSAINQTYTYLGYAGRNSITSTLGVGVIDILDYANTNKFKTLKSLSGVDNNGSGWASLESGLWRSTAAITKIKIFDAQPGTSLTQHSNFSLYGVKA